MAERLRIHIVTAALPPALDGIGDYSARLTTELVRAGDVTLLTGVRQQPSPIPGATIRQVFDPEIRASVRALAAEVERDRPDWLVLQFNQFSFGRGGVNPYLPWTMRRIRRCAPDTRFALMAHEDFVDAGGLKATLMSAVQRWQLRSLGRTADVVFFSIEPWVRRYSAWFSGKAVVHLPVGSNMPLVDIQRGEARARLGISARKCVMGAFGAAHSARMVDLISRALTEARAAGHDVQPLYIGPNGAAVRAALSDFAVIADGPLPPDEVSRRFAAMDVFLAPYPDGVSTRRSALMAALQHGVATVGTRGELTDDLFAACDGRAILLAECDSPAEFARQVVRLLDDDALRRTVSCGASALYEREFAWPRIAAKMLGTLRICDGSPVTG